MKATAKLLAAVLAVGGTMVAIDAAAQNPAARGSRGASAMPRGGHAGIDHGGSRGGRWNGGGHYWGGGGRYRGGARYWGGGHGRYWAPRYSFYFGVPVLWGSYWGAPYFYDSYPGSTVIYREAEREVYPEGSFSGPTTSVPQSDGAPTQGPLYMNYCDSAKAYFPKIASCPEGWKLTTPTQ